MVHSGIVLYSPMLYHGTRVQDRTVGLARLGDMLLGGGLNIRTCSCYCVAMVTACSLGLLNPLVQLLGTVETKGTKRTL